MLRALFLALTLTLTLTPTALTAQTPQRPNILLAISDDQSFPHASAYGCKGIDTPAFDRVAKDGVLFDNAFAASPGCSPSRAALLTGRHTWQLEHAGTHASSFAKKYVTFPELLEAAGYAVGFTGKGWSPGNWQRGGRERNPAGPGFNRRTARPPHRGISRTDYAANFKDFLDANEGDAPFCFWYGAREPHRSFENGAGVRAGKQLADATVPGFLPATETVRGDILDYFTEIEWFDTHLGRILALLEERSLLDNTLVIVTSDNGMAFPRAKANVYEYGVHVPLAVCWPEAIPGGRRIEDVVGFVDLTATILAAARIDHPSARYAPAGASLLGVLRSDASGRVDAQRAAYFGRERHSSSRWENRGYPQRAVRTARYLYIRNFRPDRWPAGAPQKFGKGNYAKAADRGVLGPMHGAYHDIDACPTLTELIARRADPVVRRFFHLAVDQRPGEELFDVVADPFCLDNLAAEEGHADVRARLAGRLEQLLRATGDARVTAADSGEIWETYRRFSRIRTFPRPAHAGK